MMETFGPKNGPVNTLCCGINAKQNQPHGDFKNLLNKVKYF